MIWRSDCKDGFDLPSACCEKDGTLLRGDDHDIPWQTHWWYGREQTYEFDVPDTLLEPLGEFFHGHWLAKLRPGVDFARRHTGPIDSPQLMEFSNLWINCILDPGGISPDSYDIAPDADCIPNAAKLLRSLLDAIDGLDDALRSCPANTFADIVAKYGLASSNGVWDEDAWLMVERLGFTLSDLIAYRDDVFSYLLSRGFSEEDAWHGMERVRRGIGLPVVTDEMSLACDKWVIDRCKKIKYLFPKAHVIEYILYCLGGKGNVRQ